MPYDQEPRFLELFDVRRFAMRRRAGLDRPTQLGFLLLLVLVALSTWLGQRHTRTLYDTQVYVAESHRVIGQVRIVLSTLIDAESAVRGYVISGSETNLGPYFAATDVIEGRIAELERLTDASERQQTLVRRLQSRATAQRERLDRIVAAGRAGDMPAAAEMVRSNEGMQGLNEVRDVILEIESNEDLRLSERVETAQKSHATARLTGISVGVAGLFLVVLVYNLVRRFDRVRSRATQEAADARERFRVTLDSIGDAVLVADPDGCLAFCNVAGRSILGIGDADLGRPLSELMTLVVAATGEPVATDVTTQARLRGGVHRTEPDSALRLAGGRSVPVDATAASILGQGGRSQGVVLVVRDVSERREHEREVERSNQRFRSLVLATSQIVWTTDGSGFVREDSPSWRQFTGQTYEQWKGVGWLDALHHDDRERVQQAWKEAILGKRPFVVEYRLRVADGSFRWSMSRSVPVLETDGAIREWVGMNYDIQARKEAEEAQRDASRRKDEFIALLAHELRNPLAPLRHGLEVLKSGPTSDAPRALELMDRQMSHMVRLIDDLLDLSRISQGKLELRLERIDLREVLRQSLEAARPAMMAKNQDLNISLPAAPMWVDGDAVRLAQVVTNLLNNATKYSGDGASIWLTAEREGTRHLVSVRDTGKGIPTELRPRVWDLFLQGGGNAERVEGGLGIGLTLVKRLVELHSGSVAVYSEGVGTGSEFTVRLPAAAARTSPAPVKPPPRRTTTAALRILVVDDNEDSAESLAMLLRLGGHSVRAAFRGETGLVEFARFHPALVLCDIRMPDMSGYEVARRLRSLPGGDGPLLVALTGFGAGTDRESSSRAGFDRHLVKPVDPDVLIELVEEAGQRHAAARDGGANA